MPVQIRRGVFETNSSSTHSLTMCLQSDYNVWKSGKVYFNYGGAWSSLSVNKDKMFVTKDELIEILTNSKYPPDQNLSELSDDEFDDYLSEDGAYYSYAGYFDSDTLETFENSYTTPNGETVIAFGKYGYS